MAHPPLRWRTGFGTTLVLSMGAGPLVLYALSALAPLVVADLGVTRAQFGSFATVAFVVAALASVAGGWTADRFDGRRVMMLLFALSGVGLVAAAAAPTYPWLVAAVVLAGLALSLSNPVTNQLVSAHVAPGRQGLLMGVKQSGVQMSQFATGLLLPTAAVLLDWRGALLVGALVAPLGLALTRLFVPAGQAVDLPQVSGDRRLPPAVRWLTAYTLLMGAGIQCTVVYLPLYSYEQAGFPLQAAGLTAAVMGGVGVAARIAWGRLAEQLARPERLLAPMAAASAVRAVAAAAAGSPRLGLLVWGSAAVFGASSIAANVVVQLVLVRTIPRHLVGRATGALGIGLFTGFAAGPVSFGLLADRAGYLAAWLAVVTLYGLAVTLIGPAYTASLANRK